MNQTTKAAFAPSRRVALGLGLGTLVAAVLPLAARSQAPWPTRPVKIVVRTPPVALPTR